MNRSVLDVFNAEWKSFRRELVELRIEVQHIATRERAESAGADVVYDAAGDLPTGFLGARATVADDGTGNPAAYWHDGTTWRKVTVT